MITSETSDWPEHDGHRCWSKPHPDSPVREVWEAAELRTTEAILAMLRADAESWEAVAEQNASDKFDEPDPERDELHAQATLKARAIHGAIIQIEDDVDPGDHSTCAGHYAGTDTPNYSAEGDWRPPDDPVLADWRGYR